jgi:cytochrome b561
MTAQPGRFSGLQRTLHWLMAIMILIMLFIGVAMVSTVKPRFLALISIHKPLGIAILVLALLRLGVRLRFGVPPLPIDPPLAQQLAARLSHMALCTANRNAAHRLGDAVSRWLSDRAL